MKAHSPLMKIVTAAVCVSLILTVAVFVSRTLAEEKKMPVEVSQLPTVISSAIEQAFPNGRILKVEKEVEGEDPGQYDVYLSLDGNEYEVEVSPDGRIIETELKETDESQPERQQDKQWTDTFDTEDCTFVSAGRNRFFILEPGYQLVLESPAEKVAITVTDKTKMVGNVQTRIVEEREEGDGQLKEVSRNYFAICKEHGDVFYFGEAVDIYKNGKVVAHEGQWQAGEANSRAGIMMPGTVLLGSRFYQEIAPNAMDRAEIVRTDVTMETPAGTFTNCLQIEETSGLDPDEKCYKTYAPGIGLIQDEDLLLIRYGKTQPTTE